jgi:hypothetical protein
MLYSFRATVDGQNVILAEKNPLEGKYEAIVVLTTPLRTDAISPLEQSFTRPSYPLSLKDNMGPSVPTPVVTTAVPSSGLRQSVYADPPVAQSRLSTTRAVSPVTPASGPVSDNLSTLYHEKAKRDARRNPSSGDIYVDVNRDAYQRFMQGEQIQLVFEEGGNYITSSFILVENRTQLYVNFYQFNEGKNIPQEKVKMLSQIFDIKGSLPDFIKVCKPAQVVSKNGGYVIVNKGILIFESGEN